MKDNLKVDDIDGAKAGPKYKAFHNKPQFLQSDVPGAVSKVSLPINTAYYILKYLHLI
jgi:hypothetical protein